MAKHWSNWVAVTERQARALDMMAKNAGRDSGIELLLEVADLSRSKLAKSDRLTVQSWVDDAFQQFGTKYV